MLAYIISANTIAAAIQRDVQVNEISSASQQLVDRIGAEEQKASSTLAQHTADLAQLAAEEEQARTEQAIIKVQTQNLLRRGHRRARTRSLRRRRRWQQRSRHSPRRARGTLSIRRFPVRSSPSTPT